MYILYSSKGHFYTLEFFVKKEWRILTSIHHEQFVKTKRSRKYVAVATQRTIVGDRPKDDDINSCELR